MKGEEMKRSAKTILIVFMTAALAFTAAGCGSSDAGKEAARINDTVITCGQVDKYATILYDTYGYDSSELTDDVKSDILDTMVDCEILRQYYEEQGVDIYDDAYDSAKEAFISSVEKEEESFLKESGITEEDLVEYYSLSYLSERFYADIAAEYTEDEINEAAAAYYNDNLSNYAVGPQKRISTIFVDDESSAAAVQAAAASGSDFAKLAAEQSTDEASAANGGDLGFFTEEELYSHYGDGIFSLPVGAVSDPVQLDSGFAVIKVTGENNSGYETFESIRDEIKYAIYSQRFGERINEIKAGMDVTVTGLA